MSEILNSDRTYGYLSDSLYASYMDTEGTSRNENVLKNLQLIQELSASFLLHAKEFAIKIPKTEMSETSSGGRRAVIISALVRKQLEKLSLSSMEEEVGMVLCGENIRSNDGMANILLVTHGVKSDTNERRLSTTMTDPSIYIPRVEFVSSLLELPNPFKGARRTSEGYTNLEDGCYRKHILVHTHPIKLNAIYRTDFSANPSSEDYIAAQQNSKNSSNDHLWGVITLNQDNQLLACFNATDTKGVTLPVRVYLQDQVNIDTFKGIEPYDSIKSGNKHIKRIRI